jgi:hypothetical protein
MENWVGLMLGFEPRVTFLFRPKAFVTGGRRRDFIGLVDDHHDWGGEWGPCHGL